MPPGTSPPRGGMPRRNSPQAHIPGAQFFDIDDLSDTTSPLPHMLPRPEKFASRMRRMGVGDGKRIIAYDTTGLFSAARCWWMFKVFGHEDVAVLDGGLKKWLAEGRPVEDGPALKPQERHFTPRVRAMMVRDMKQVATALKTGTAQVADARSGTQVPRRGSRTPPARPRRPHAGREERPLCQPPQPGRHAQVTRRNRSHVSRRPASTSPNPSSPPAAPASPQRSCHWA